MVNNHLKDFRLVGGITHELFQLKNINDSEGADDKVQHPKCSNYGSNNVAYTIAGVIYCSFDLEP